MSSLQRPHTTGKKSKIWPPLITTSQSKRQFFFLHQMVDARLGLGATRAMCQIMSYESTAATLLHPLRLPHLKVGVLSAMKTWLLPSNVKIGLTKQYNYANLINDQQTHYCRRLIEHSFNVLALAKEALQRVHWTLEFPTFIQCAFMGRKTMTLKKLKFYKSHMSLLTL